jgi:cysteinyl-tRNA synthetase
MVESSTPTAHRVETQKAYKLAKKKRRKVRKAVKKRDTEQQQQAGGGEDEESAAPPTKPTKWCRVGTEDAGCPKATDRPVDEAEINRLLMKRSEAKIEKNYTVSDEITKTLVGMEIVYDDAKKQWHTRLLSTVGHKGKRDLDNNASAKEPVAKKTKHHSTLLEEPSTVN